MSELRFVSDVHLGAVPEPAAAAYAASFALFLRRAAEDGVDLVLLGDVFDLLGAVDVPAHRRESAPAQEDVAIDALERIHARHGDVFSALGDVASAPSAARSMSSPATTMPSSSFHPCSNVCASSSVAPCSSIPGSSGCRAWCMPSTATSTTTSTASTSRSGPAAARSAFHPPPTCRTAARALSRAPCAVPALVRSGVRLAGPRRVARREAYVRDVVVPGAAALGLPASTAAATLAVSEPSLASIGSRLARQAVTWRRPVAPTQLDGYLHVGVRHVHDVLRRTGHDAPFYVVGHAHIAESLPLDGATYLNCGTWSPFFAKGSTDRRPSYVSVRHGAGVPSASIERWSEVGGR